LIKAEVGTTANIETIENLLKEIGNGTPDIHGLAVVSSEGLPIASELLEEAEMERVAAMTAAMLAVGKRSADELARGIFEQVFIKGELGAIIIIEIGEEAVLTAVTGTKPRLGLVFMNMRRAAEQIRDLL
jgi:predicted regulator of Ras-like GTPase activity (Roadblock/LC7/MglB family)